MRGVSGWRETCRGDAEEKDKRVLVLYWYYLLLSEEPTGSDRGVHLSLPIFNPKGETRMSPAPALNKARAIPESHFDGRLHIRFPIALDLSYAVLRNRIEYRGIGRTLDISSGGVLFEAAEIFDVAMARQGAAIELGLNWPCLLDERCSLKLIIGGHIVRFHGRQIAVRMSHYEFRTAGVSSEKLHQSAISDK